MELGNREGSKGTLDYEKENSDGDPAADLRECVVVSGDGGQGQETNRDATNGASGETSAERRYSRSQPEGGNEAQNHEKEVEIRVDIHSFGSGELSGAGTSANPAYTSLSKIRAAPSDGLGAQNYGYEEEGPFRLNRSGKNARDREQDRTQGQKDTAESDRRRSRSGPDGRFSRSEGGGDLCNWGYVDGDGSEQGPAKKRRNSRNRRVSAPANIPKRRWSAQETSRPDVSPESDERRNQQKRRLPPRRQNSQPVAGESNYQDWPEYMGRDGTRRKRRDRRGGSDLTTRQERCPSRGEDATANPQRRSRTGSSRRERSSTSPLPRDGARRSRQESSASARQGAQFSRQSSLVSNSPDGEVNRRERTASHVPHKHRHRRHYHPRSPLPVTHHHNIERETCAECTGGCKLIFFIVGGLLMAAGGAMVKYAYDDEIEGDIFIPAGIILLVGGAVMAGVSLMFVVCYYKGPTSGYQKFTESYIAGPVSGTTSIYSPPVNERASRCNTCTMAARGTTGQLMSPIEDLSYQRSDSSSSSSSCSTCDEEIPPDAATSAANSAAPAQPPTEPTQRNYGSIT